MQTHQERAQFQNNQLTRIFLDYNHPHRADKQFVNVTLAFWYFSSDTECSTENIETEFKSS